MTSRIILTHQIELDIPFFDVDSMNIVWHGHYIKYLEIARCSLLEKLNYNYAVMKQHGFAWPIVKVECKYIKPLIFNQKIVVVINLIEFETCLKFNYLILDAQTRQKLTQASTTQVAVCIKTEQLQYQTPDSLRTAVQRYLDSQHQTT